MSSKFERVKTGNQQGNLENLESGIWNLGILESWNLTIKALNNFLKINY